MARVFEEVCDEMEESAEQLFTIAELQYDMECLARSDHVYSKISIKQKLEERYGEYVFFTEVCGRKNVICFKNMASTIISDKWYTDRKTTIKMKVSGL